MKFTAVLAALAVLPFFWMTDQRTTPAPTHEDSQDRVVVLTAGDSRMDGALACLDGMLEAKNDRTSLRPILEAAGFELTKVTIRKIKRNPDRIRYGFEYVSVDQVKTVYWETDCLAVETEPASKIAGR